MMLEKFRRVENLHIVFWLIKDVCWISDFKLVGVLMILPTLSVGIWLTWRTRRMLSELAHNAAVTSWICANSVWMIGEFFYEDTKRPYAQFFFVIGIVILALYYSTVFYRKFKTPRPLR